MDQARVISQESTKATKAMWRSAKAVPRSGFTWRVNQLLLYTGFVGIHERATTAALFPTSHQIMMDAGKVVKWVPAPPVWQLLVSPHPLLGL